jgi:plastocyanin
MMSSHLTRSLLAAVLSTGAILGLSATAIAADESVDITDTLEPVQLSIEPGSTVTWRNTDDERHRMRSREGPVEFDSGNLEAGESFSQTFDVEGAYPYYDHRDRDDSAYFGMIVVGGSVDPDAPLPDAGTVSIVDRSFSPGAIAIATGGTVDWSNDDGEAHTVTASAFDSSILNGGANFSQTFAEPGSFPYFCAIHPEMRGVITVSDPTGEPSPTEVEPVVEAPELDAAVDPIATPTVSIIDRAFQPEAISVSAGDTVAWDNDDGEGHTVTAVDGAFNSGVMTVGDAFSMTFETAGTFDYFCAIHPEMQGTVSVGP